MADEDLMFIASRYSEQLPISVYDKYFQPLLTTSNNYRIGDFDYSEEYSNDPRNTHPIITDGIEFRPNVFLNTDLVQILSLAAHGSRTHPPLFAPIAETPARQATSSTNFFSIWARDGG